MLPELLEEPSLGGVTAGGAGKSVLAESGGLVELLLLLLLLLLAGFLPEGGKFGLVLNKLPLQKFELAFKRDVKSNGRDGGRLK